MQSRGVATAPRIFARVFRGFSAFVVGPGGPPVANMRSPAGALRARRVWRLGGGLIATRTEL
jgi:hypothetical protein